MGDYVQAVREAGGDPVELSNSDDPRAVLGTLDGLLLTGGPDVDPSRYGQPAHPTTEVAQERDRFELPLTQEAVNRDVPLFAICRGVQVLNVAQGGTLTQDIPSQVKTDLNHAINVPKTHHTHPVEVTPGSRLAETLGMTSASDSCPVNSRHHQALDQIAVGFKVSARAPDGVVEAIEKPDATFCLGVQWHPENFWRTGEFKGLFDAFVAAAAKRSR